MKRELLSSGHINLVASPPRRFLWSADRCAHVFSFHLTLSYTTGTNNCTRNFFLSFFPSFPSFRFPEGTQIGFPSTTSWPAPVHQWVKRNEWYWCQLHLVPSSRKRMLHIAFGGNLTSAIQLERSVAMVHSRQVLGT